MSSFWNPCCFHFRLFFYVFFFFWGGGVCFWLYVFMLALFLICFYFVILLFLFCFLFAFRLWKPLFSLQFRCFIWVMLVKWHFFVYDLVLAYFFSFVVCLLSKQWSRSVLCLCCLWCNKTKWFSCLHPVVSFPLCCFIYFFDICFPFLGGPKTDTTKKKTEKGTIVFQLAQVCSQIVFQFWGAGQTMHVCWKHNKQWFRHIWKKENWTKIVKKVESKLGPRLSQNCFFTKHVAQHNWTMFWLKKWNCLFICFWLILLQKEEHFWKKQERKTEKLGPSFDSRKGNRGPILTHIYIYIIYTHIYGRSFKPQNRTYQLQFENRKPHP